MNEKSPAAKSPTRKGRTSVVRMGQISTTALQARRTRDQGPQFSIFSDRFLSRPTLHHTENTSVSVGTGTAQGARMKQLLAVVLAVLLASCGRSDVGLERDVPQVAGVPGGTDVRGVDAGRGDADAGSGDSDAGATIATGAPEGALCGDDVAIQVRCQPGLVCVYPLEPVSEHTPGTCQRYLTSGSTCSTDPSVAPCAPGLQCVVRALHDSLFQVGVCGSRSGPGEPCGDDIAILRWCTEGLTCVFPPDAVSEHTPGSCQ